MFTFVTEVKIVEMKTVAKYVTFLELHPYLPSYSYMFMLEAMTYKVDTMYLCDFMQIKFVYYLLVLVLVLVR